MLGRFLREDKDFFLQCRRSIRIKNNRMLFDGCIAYALVLTFYTVLSAATDTAESLRRMYYVYDIVHVLLCVIVFTRPKPLRERFDITQGLCAVFELSILSFFALEGACLSPDTHSLYVPIAILLVQIFFIHRAMWSFLINVVYTAGFAALSMLHKTPAASQNDLYIAVATFVSATIAFALIARIRHSEGRALIQLECLSQTDMLTGLSNKATIEDICRKRLSEHAGDTAFMILDLDDFKLVNDRYGHEVGDEVLRNTGLILRDFFEADEPVGRFGGDEFIVLMRAEGGADAVRARAAALLSRVSALRFSAPGLSVCFTAGVAFRREDDDLRALFARADRALYEAKGEGKSRFRIAE